MALQQVAVIDGYGENSEVSLSFSDENGEEIFGIGWPDDWPDSVSTKFLRSQGYIVITA